MLIKNISFKFSKDDAHYFFNNVQMNCMSNALNMIIGDNGVGKSTLLTILRGAADANTYLTAGVQLEGVNYYAVNNQIPDAFTQQVHMVHQKYDWMIADQFSFEQNLRFACLPTWPFLSSLPHESMLEIATNIGINVHTPVYNLSGGQRQLLAILMALQKPTKLLLLDEPTATLDTYNAAFIMDMLSILAKKLQVTMLIICHDQEIIKHYAQRCFVVEKGTNGQRTIREVDVLKI